MIVRIMGEGQWTVDDDQVDGLNAADDAVSAALEAGDQDALSAALLSLSDQVRERGVPIPDDELADSDLILPPLDSTVDQVRTFLDEIGSSEGLIPG